MSKIIECKGCELIRETATQFVVKFSNGQREFLPKSVCKVSFTDGKGVYCDVKLPSGLASELGLI